MTPQELKNSIIQLAIQGKLVEQRPEEGTGEELYRKIQAEKRKLVEAGKIRKEKPLPEIAEDEIPFDIPDSWKWVRLGSVASVERGSGIKRSETAPNGVPCVRYGEIYTSYGYSFTTTVSFVPKSIAVSCHMANYGDVLCTLTGEWKEEIAKATAYLGKDPIAIGGDLAKISSEAYNPLLLVYFFFAPFLIQQKAAKANGTMIVHIGKEQVCNLLIPLPPLEEQKRIVAKIEELLPLIDRYEQAWNRLEEFNKRFPDDMQKSLLQAAIQGKLVEQRPEEGTGEELYRKIQAEKRKLVEAGKIRKEKPLPEIAEDEIPFDIPDSWKWVRLGSVASVERGSGIKRSETAPNGVPCVRYGEIYTSYGYSFTTTVSFVPKSIAVSCHMANYGDVLCTLTGEWKEEIAKATAYLGKDPIAIGGDLAKISSEAYNPLLLVYFFFAPFLIQQKAAKANGTMIVHIGKEQVCNLLIPLPPLEEQKRIVAKIEEMLPLCEHLR